MCNPARQLLAGLTDTGSPSTQQFKLTLHERLFQYPDKPRTRRIRHNKLPKASSQTSTIMTADSIDTVMQALIARLLIIFNILTTFISTFRHSEKSSESLHSEEPPIPLQAASNFCVGIVGKPVSISSLISKGGFTDVHHCYSVEYGEFRLELNPQRGQDVDGVVLLQDASSLERRHWKGTGKPFAIEGGDYGVYCPVIEVLKKIYERDNRVDLELGLPLRGEDSSVTRSC
ncbi:hypothetical protein QWA68_014883 [Fusarium oxysporum]|nr:hypothetical protein QWA68_014883 [Fusarium oxysporum]